MKGGVASMSKLDNERKYREQRRQMIRDAIGTVCEICGRDDAHIAHRKDGKPHIGLTEMGRKKLEAYLDIHKDEFVRLCKLCHKGVHWAMKFLDMDWETIFFNSVGIKVSGSSPDTSISCPQCGNTRFEYLPFFKTSKCTNCGLWISSWAWYHSMKGHCSVVIIDDIKKVSETD